MPEADNLTIHVMAALAEREAQLISARTKAAFTKFYNLLKCVTFQLCQTFPKSSLLLRPPP